MANTNIKPVLKELKGKIPTKAQVLKTIEDFDLQIDTKKWKARKDEIQKQVLDLAKETAENPKVKTYTRNILSSDITNNAFLKLKEVLPNQAMLDRLDKLRLSYINEDAVKTKTKKTTSSKAKTAAEPSTKKKVEKPSVFEAKAETAASTSAETPTKTSPQENN